MKYVIVSWMKPRKFGEIQITGYEFYVDNVVVAQLDASQTEFNISGGVWCQEYAYQIRVRKDPPSFML